MFTGCTFAVRRPGPAISPVIASVRDDGHEYDHTAESGAYSLQSFRCCPQNSPIEHFVTCSDRPMYQVEYSCIDETGRFKTA